MPKLIIVDGKYYFDAMDGSEAVECPVWIETSKKNEKHPKGKPWIKLPKNNVANRQYFSKELFDETNVNGEVEVEVKTTAPRILGAHGGVKAEVVKYLDDATAAEYTDLVTRAVDAYKAAKISTKKKKLEEMTEEELKAFIIALQNGTDFKAPTTGPKSFMDMFTDAEYARYNEIIALSQENKANRPKAVRGPLSDEEKAARSAKRKATTLSKAEALLAALQAKVTVADEDDLSDLIDEDEE